MKLRKILGANVAALRRSRELNQAQLAAMLKVNKQTVYRIERGSTNVGIDTLFDLAKALRVEPAVLLVEPNASTRSAATVGRRLQQIAEHLQKALRIAQGALDVPE